MRKPQTRRHRVLRCDGSVAFWKDVWVRETCGECDQPVVPSKWRNDGVQVNQHIGPIQRVPALNLEDHKRRCDLCGEEWPTTEAILAQTYTAAALAMAVDQDSAFRRMLRD